LGIRSTIVAICARRRRLTTAITSPPAVGSETRTPIDERWRQTGRGLASDPIEHRGRCRLVWSHFQLRISGR